jgi:hypothetical protein
MIISGTAGFAVSPLGQEVGSDFSDVIGQADYVIGSPTTYYVAHNLLGCRPLLSDMTLF